MRGLSHQLGVARGLRPLKRTVPSPHAVELDETATAEAIADNGVLDLVLRPARERWLDLRVLVDDGLSMRVWTDTVTELARLLGSLGIFRKVSVQDHDFATRRATARLTSFERTVLLVFSDATASCWRDGTALRHLATWSRRAPTAVINPLPARLWSGTGLDAEFTTVRTHRRAPVNTALRTPHATAADPRHGAGRVGPGTLGAVSDFIGARIGRSVDFPVLLADRTGTLQLPEQRAPFGELPGGEEGDEEDAWQASAAQGVVEVHTMVGDFIVTSLGLLIAPDLVLTAGEQGSSAITGAALARRVNARHLWRQDTGSDEPPGLVLLRTGRQVEPGRTVEVARTAGDWPSLPGTLYVGLGPRRDRLTPYRCGAPRQASGSVLRLLLPDSRPPADRIVGAPVLAGGKLLGVVVDVTVTGEPALHVRALSTLSDASLNLLESGEEGSEPDPENISAPHGLNNLNASGVPGFSLQHPYHPRAFTWLESSVRAEPRGVYIYAGPRGSLISRH